MDIILWISGFGMVLSVEDDNVDSRLGSEVAGVTRLAVDMAREAKIGDEDGRGLWNED